MVAFLERNKKCGRIGRISTILLLFFFCSSAGVRLEETSLLSSQRQNEKTNIGIRISESVKETKTLEPEILNEKINSTEFSTYVSHVYNSEEKIERPTSVNLEKKLDANSNLGKETDKEETTENAESSTDSEERSNYYDAIKPTKTVNPEKLKITQTDMKSYQNSGEVKGVSTNRSRPQESERATNYNRVKRGYGNFLEKEEVENRKEAFKNDRIDENKKKLNKNRVGKNYNQISETLEKLAKVTINNDQVQRPDKAVAGPTIFRESREEENRKASPDIQDIITGIVNILHAKTTKHPDSHGGRPHRPTSIRINNRGPPRISDVPPLDFDGPGAFRPLPPKKIPPPYPFDIPHAIPSIPLPPQPHKPGMSKLPSHPFIEGVPIPELVVPGGLSEKPHGETRPSETVYLEYDTISASEPQNGQNVPIIELNNAYKPGVAQAPMASTTPRDEIKTSSMSSGLLTNFTETTTGKPDYIKSKPGGEKSPSSSASTNKNSNKRVRPNPASRPGENPPQNKIPTVDLSPVPKEEHNKSAAEDSSKVENSTRKENDTSSGYKEENNNNTKPNETTTEATPLAEATTISETTKVTAEEVTSGSNESTTKIIGESTLRTPVKSETKIEISDFELPVLLEPSLGVGEATPVLESSIPELSMLEREGQSSTPTTSLTSHTPTTQLATTETSHPFKARPGIVLDDPEYKPGVHKRPVISARPIVTSLSSSPNSYYGEIFDVTVHAVQGPGGDSSAGKPYIVPVDIDGIQNPQVIKGDVSVITKPEDGQKFVSIDGKRTYINLFGEVSPTKINPTTSKPTVLGTGYAISQKESPLVQPMAIRPSASPPRKPYKRPSHPPVRIDTCIVGDDSTCDSAQNERCRTEDGVSSCHCRPGYNRKKHRDTCRRVVSMLTSIRVDRLYDKRVKWQENLRDPDSEDYQQLSYEAGQAIDSAMSMTPFSDDFINTRINSIYTAKNLENNEPAVYVNLTIQLEENLDTVRPAVKQDIQRHLLRVIQRRNNNVGNSAVWVDEPPGSVLALQDVDECSSEELHDCHKDATCLNTFGSFKCQCPDGLRDPWIGNVHREGRFCEMCPSAYCNSRGECKFEHGQQVCHCSGSFYGTQCEIDGEVLGVAIGASVAAAIIIILTLVCLCMWSRRWSREQKSAVGSGMGSPVFGYMATGPTVKTPSVGSPPYQVSMEDRIRWAQIADVMAKSNHYTQPEPPNKRPAFGGYPTLPSHTMAMSGTLPLPAIAPPVPLPRLTLSNKPGMGTYGAHSQFGSIHQSNHGIRSSLETTSSSEEEDRADLLGRNFNAPRPRSRTSLANQSGIYYDVDFDRSEAYSKQNTIPMNTYALNSQHQTRPYFR